MKKLALLGVVLTFGLLTVSPSAFAFHGAPYHAHGTAVSKDDQVYLADVTWTGWGFAPFDYFIVDVHDALGNVVAHEALPGYEVLVGGGPQASVWEIFLYSGLDAATNGNVLKITGVQQEIGPYYVLVQTMVYEGTYRDYALALVVDTPN